MHGARAERTPAARRAARGAPRSSARAHARWRPVPPRTAQGPRRCLTRRGHTLVGGCGCRDTGAVARSIPGRTSFSTNATRLGWTLRSPNFLYLTIAAELAARLAPPETTGVRLARTRRSAIPHVMDGRTGTSPRECGSSKSARTFPIGRVGSNRGQPGFPFFCLPPCVSEHDGGPSPLPVLRVRRASI